MRDAEFDSYSREKPGAASRPLPLKFIFLAVAVFFWLVLAAWPYAFSQRPSTCAACRLDRTDHDLLGIRWASYQESELSRWYAANVEASHAHAWTRCTQCRRFGIPFIYGGYACYVGAPITGLSTRIQREAYQHSRQPLEAKKLFLKLGQWQEGSDLLTRSLMEWVDADYSGTWEEWWEKAKTVRENRNS